MTTNIKIVEASYLSDYKIKIKFDDKNEQTVDFEPFLKASKNPHIRKYLDLDLFKKFAIVDGDLDWNDFDLCFPIDDLYSNSILPLSSNSSAS